MNRKQLKIFKDIPSLETERLKLERIKVLDISDVYEYASDPRVSRFLLWEPHKTINYTRAYIEFIELLYKKGKFFDWGIHLKSENKMIGTCGFSSIDIHNNKAVVGYVLNSRYWGEGIATEALLRVIKFAFDVLKLSRLEARFIKENAQSLRVLEKCGFRYLDTEPNLLKVKGKMREIVVYYLENIYE